MELTELRYFYNVAIASSFVRGAARCHVTPGAVSQAVKKLEAELGTQLFFRTTRQVVLTDEGRKIMARCERIFAEVDCIREDAAGESALSGELRIGAMEVFSHRILPAALGEMVKKSPGVLPRTFEMIPQLISRELAVGGLDVGFSIGAESTRHVDVASLGISPGRLVCGTSHPLAAVGYAGARELATYPSVVPKFYGEEHLPPLDAFPESAGTRTVGATIELLQMGVELVRSGAFLGFFPHVSIADRIESGELVMLEWPGADASAGFDLQVLTPKNLPKKRRVLALIEDVKARLEGEA